jgi:hypothetical protein
MTYQPPKFSEKEIPKMAKTYRDHRKASYQICHSSVGKISSFNIVESGGKSHLYSISQPAG